MVKKCVLCKITYVENSPISFHSFPKDPTKRLEWLNVCNLEEVELSSQSSVCSKHFKDDDYVQAILPTKRLLPSAVPQPNTPVLTATKSGNYHTKPDKLAVQKVRYIGDLRPERFSNPLEAEKNLKLIRAKFSQQLRRIKTLKRQNQRLQERVISSKKKVDSLLEESEYSNL